MGGSHGGGGGGGDNSALMAQMKANAEAQAAAAREAQYKTQQQAYTNSVNSALQQGSAGTQQAQQQIGQANQYQQSKDIASQQYQLGNMQAGAQGAIGGGGFNPSSSAKIGLSNIGAIGGGGVASPAQVNPAAQATAAQEANKTGAGSNKFTRPASSDLKLGGY